MTPQEALNARIEHMKAKAEALQLTKDPDSVTHVGDVAEKLAAAMIPPGLTVTDPDVYRAHVFKTEIARAMVSCGFDRRHCVDGLLANVFKGTRESKQLYVKTRAQQLLQNKGAIIVLPGPRGTGKTTIAAQIAIDRLWEDWHSARNGGEVTCRTTSYRKINEIVAKLKGFYADFGSISMDRMETIRDFLTGVMRSSTGGLIRGGCDLLVIDELNEADENSKYKDRILADIIDRRYSRCLDTILITNQPAAEFSSTANESIISRLNEHGAVIPCEWQSFRDSNINDHPHI